MDAAGLIRQAWKLLETDLASLGYELVEIDMGQQGGSTLLRVFIDKDIGGISLDDCTRATHLLNILLDDAEFYDGRYILEVSSPGINRPVRKREHFVRYAGENIRLETHVPQEGRTRVRGKLLGLDGDMVRLDVSGQEIAIHLENIKKARLDR